MEEKRFCYYCGEKLIEKSFQGRMHRYCQNCDRIHYENPLPAVATLVVNNANQLLLVKRSVEPAKGEWCLPGGFIETDESIEEAALRELEEETGIKGTIEGLLKDLPRGVKGQLIAGTATAGASLLASYFQGEFREQEPGETMEEYLAARRESVGKKMRVYMDNYFKTDPEYSALDDAGRDAFVARYNLQSGGMPTGIMRTNKAGVIERDYRDEGGFVPVGIKEKADDVPAMLSKNEFVFTADAVRGAGNGSIEKGAQKMYDTMKKLEKRVT